jgi:uncharacterized membrane protein
MSRVRNEIKEVIKMKNKPKIVDKVEPHWGWYTGRIMIWIGVIIGAILPQTFESYNYGTLYYWYGEYHMASMCGWIFVVIGLILEGIGWMHGRD